MKRLVFAFFVVISMGNTAFLHADDALLGTYNGGFLYTGGITSSPTQVGVRLVLNSVENGLVKGTATLLGGGPCQGDYPMQGKYEGNKLGMISTAKGGRAGDCTFGFRAVKEGDKLTGTTGGYAMTLSK